MASVRKEILIAATPEAVWDALRDWGAVWLVVDGPYTHHNASAEVFAADGGKARFVWVADLLPDALEAVIEPMMERGTRVLGETLG